MSDEKTDVMHNQLINHNKEVQERNDVLFKQNTKLLAQVNHYKTEIETFQNLTKDKLRKTIETYDLSGDEMLNYMVVRNLIKHCGEESIHNCPWVQQRSTNICHYHEADQLRPMKLQGELK